MAALDRETYRRVYGPTVGDRVTLSDTGLVVEVEADDTPYGDEVLGGCGKTWREGFYRRTHESDLDMLTAWSARTTDGSLSDLATPPRDEVWDEVAAESDRPSSGLSGMRERASLLGGYLVVESFLGQGTQIIAALPLTDQPLERRKYDRNHSAGR